MGQFYASIQGNRGQATRQGTKNSGLEGHVRGWSIGARVIMGYDKDKQEDVCSVYLTSGSSYGRSDKLIGQYRISDIEKEEK